MFGFFSASGFNLASIWTVLAAFKMYDLWVRAFILEHSNC
jgi:hypothetical protein